MNSLIGHQKPSYLLVSCNVCGNKSGMWAVVNLQSTECAWQSTNNVDCLFIISADAESACGMS